MRRMRATGTGTWGRALLLIQLVGLVLAFMFGFFEATGLLERQSIIFNITDAAWPLSMLWMVVVGISVIVERRLSGWKRFVPLLCPFWFPIGMVAMRAFGDKSGVVGFGLAAVLWATSWAVTATSLRRLLNPLFNSLALIHERPRRRILGRSLAGFVRTA